MGLQRLCHNLRTEQKVDHALRFEPRSGARIQPTAQAVGRKWQENKHRRCERGVVTQSLQPRCFSLHARSTHVSLLPPPCDEFTTSEPLRNATLVRPPGTSVTFSP